MFIFIVLIAIVYFSYKHLCQSNKVKNTHTHYSTLNKPNAIIIHDWWLKYEIIQITQLITNRVLTATRATRRHTGRAPRGNTSQLQILFVIRTITKTVGLAILTAFARRLVTQDTREAKCHGVDRNRHPHAHSTIQRVQPIPKSRPSIEIW
jgi:hypothetical protein